MPVPAQRFNFKILPNTQTKDLLPTPPKTQTPTGPTLTDELAKVPEVEFQVKPEKPAQDGKLIEQTAHQLAKINHLNAKKTDAFMVALLESREDLAGLPFVMGDDCRTSGERTKQFNIAVTAVRQALGGGTDRRHVPQRWARWAAGRVQRPGAGRPSGIPGWRSGVRRQRAVITAVRCCARGQFLAAVQRPLRTGRRGPAES
jgi:hypothetical protein